MKCCPDCGLTKEFAAFSKDSRTKDKLNAYCRECRKQQHYEWRRKNPTKWAENKHKHYVAHAHQYFVSNLKNRYGLTWEQYLAMGTVCAICGGVGDQVDHDHKTGRVRGKLCGLCNRKLGRVKEDPSLFPEAAEYLAFEPPNQREAARR